MFEDRRSVDTALISKPLYEDRVYSNGGGDMGGCAHHPTSPGDTETVTKHFVKQTTIVPRTNSTVIPC